MHCSCSILVSFPDAFSQIGKGSLVYGPFRSRSRWNATPYKNPSGTALLAFCADRAACCCRSNISWIGSLLQSNRTLNGRSVWQPPCTFSVSKECSITPRASTSSQTHQPVTTSPVKRPAPAVYPVPSPTKRLRLSGSSSAGSEPVTVRNKYAL